MKKIPTLFERKFENHKVVNCLPNVTPGLEWVLEGEGTATLKIDGSCCTIINGELYKRYDAKKGKQPPKGAIPCQPDPDPITSHWPHWIKCDPNNPADKWFLTAYRNSDQPLSDGTYEAIGPHFQNNPYGLVKDFLCPHGLVLVDVLPTYEGLREYLRTHYMEGIVFWKDGEPRCKIKRSDFGFPWPDNEEETEKVWRGEWIPVGDSAFYNKCSKCGKITVGKCSFCNSCGAPMTDEAVDMILERWKEAVDNEV